MIMETSEFLNEEQNGRETNNRQILSPQWLKTIAFIFKKKPVPNKCSKETFRNKAKDSISPNNKKLLDNLQQGSFPFKSLVCIDNSLYNHAVIIFNTGLEAAVHLGKQYKRTSMDYYSLAEPEKRHIHHWLNENNYWLETGHELMEINKSTELFSQLSRLYHIQIPFKLEYLETYLEKIMTRKISKEEAQKRLRRSLFGAAFDAYANRKILYGHFNAL